MRLETSWKAESSMTPGHIDVYNFDGAGDLAVTVRDNGSSNTAHTYLDREKARALRDYLTALLGDKPTPAEPAMTAGTITVNVRPVLDTEALRGIADRIHAAIAGAPR